MPTEFEKYVDGICPLCIGSGRFHLNLPITLEIDQQKIREQIAMELKAKGYGLRQIQRALGYKSPRSISAIFKKRKQ